MKFSVAAWGNPHWQPFCDSLQMVGLELILGPFQTNGNLRTVTINFSRHVTYTKTAFGGGISPGSGSNTATIEIYRQIGAAAEVLWQTVTVTGTSSFNNEFDGPSMAWLSWVGLAARPWLTPAHQLTVCVIVPRSSRFHRRRST